MSNVLNLLLVEFVVVLAVSSAESPCSLDKRALDMTECLNNLKGQLFNNTAYWFGIQYRQDCPNGAVDGDMLCANPRTTGAESIAHRLLFPDQFKHKLVDRFLEVTYSHGAGSYTGCGFEVHKPSWERDIDPLSGDRITAWNTRLMPDLKFDASDSDYFTIIFYDVGNLLPHAVFVNVQGNSITDENTIKSYHGAQNPFTRRNPYVFVLFKQNSRITVSQQWIEISNTNTNGGFQISNFAKDYSLIGPVALNWLSVVGDLYSAGLADSREWLFTCPLFVSEVIDRQDGAYSFLPKPTSLSVYVNVTYQSPDIKFKLCCKEFQYQRQTVQINPFSNEIVFTRVAWSESTRSITLKKAGYYAKSLDFLDGLYTLFVVDASCALCHGTDGPRILNFIANIGNGSVATGDVVIPYTFPYPSWSPQDPPVYSVYFLLYKQENVIEGRGSDYRWNPRYVSRCAGTELNRCHFKIHNLMEDKNLTLVGANTFTATYDELAEYLRLTNSTREFCQGNPKFPKYALPCPTDSTSGVTHSGVVVACLLLIAVMLF